MTQVIKWLYLVALAAWGGSIIFLSAVIAPTVFRTLAAADAARLMRRIFPKYYLLGLICAVAGIVCVGCLLFERAFGKWSGIGSLLLLAATGGTQFWLRQTVAPRLEQLRDRKEAAPEANAEWRALHQLSVRLNAAVLVCVLALLFLVVFARVA